MPTKTQKLKTSAFKDKWRAEKSDRKTGSFMVVCKIRGEKNWWVMADYLHHSVARHIVKVHNQSVK